MILQHLTDLVTTSAGHVLALAPGDPTPVPIPTVAPTGSGVMHFLFTVVVPIIIAVLGVAILARSRKGDMSATMNSTAVALVGIAFLGLATTLAFLGLGSFLVDLAVK
jgi:hypothetical protein